MLSTSLYFLLDTHMYAHTHVIHEFARLLTRSPSLSSFFPYFFSSRMIPLMLAISAGGDLKHWISDASSLTSTPSFYRKLFFNFLIHSFVAQWKQRFWILYLFFLALDLTWLYSAFLFLIRNSESRWLTETKD